MVEIGLLTGIFSYVVFGLGIIGKLNGLLVIIAAVIYLLLFGYFLIKMVGGIRAIRLIRDIGESKTSLFLLGILFVSIVINLIGVFGPEMGFDALWYHLTLPKIFLQENRIFYLPGGLFYYSLMPKLTEMLYLVSLKFSQFGSLAKFIHFSFGVLSVIALYKLSKRYLNTKFSLLVAVLFYTTLIVGWESITANVDLVRTFFEILAIDLFLKWIEKNKGSYKINNDFIESALMLGLAISSKLIAVVSLPIYLILILFKTKRLKLAVYYLLISFVAVCPWLVFSYIKSGNPVFPLLSGVLDSSHKIVAFNLFRIIKDYWQLLYHPRDFISPVFLIFLPVVLVRILRQRKLGRLGGLGILGMFCLLTIIFWYFTPRTGGSRFILPYLPVFSLFFVWVISLEKDFFQKLFFVLVIFTAFVNCGYRLGANAKYLPLLLGKQSKQDFLMNNLNFKNGDLYDIDGKIKTTTGGNKVLIYGSHNLFYADFPFSHSSYGEAGDFNYFLTQNVELSNGLADKTRLIYNNPVTGINLYTRIIK